jgi:hypothetical protein
MEYNLLFQAFMVFYLLEILILVTFAWMLTREYHIQDQEQAARATGPAGPSASDLIKMRAKVRELQRQQE